MCHWLSEVIFIGLLKSVLSCHWFVASSCSVDSCLSSVIDSLLLLWTNCGEDTFINLNVSYWSHRTFNLFDTDSSKKLSRYFIYPEGNLGKTGIIGSAHHNTTNFKAYLTLQPPGLLLVITSLYTNNNNFPKGIYKTVKIIIIIYKYWQTIVDLCWLSVWVATVENVPHTDTPCFHTGCPCWHPAWCGIQTWSLPDTNLHWARQD